MGGGEEVLGVEQTENVLHGAERQVKSSVESHESVACGVGDVQDSD